MTRIPHAEAHARTMANRTARQNGRKDDTRVDCWPALTPGFSFDKSSRIFAIGSCFASNIELYLISQGFNVTSHNFDPHSSLGLSDKLKYSPATIRQEIEWARRIFDRDDKMRPEDADLVLCEVEPGLFYDTQLHHTAIASHDDAVARRAEVYRLYRNLFSADVVILTLGLIEVWWDDALRLYIQDAPSRQMTRLPDRYFFERLDYGQCLAEMRAIIELITVDGKCPNILLTTSPVVMGRTFTADDIWIANTYSKSVLRAVCGTIVEEVPSLDYFPSYESAMLSDPDKVWMNDLGHVQPAFVERIMARVRQVYVQEDSVADISVSDQMGKFAALAEVHDIDAALKVLAGIPDYATQRNLTFQLTAARLLMLSGQTRQGLDLLRPDLVDLVIPGLEKLPLFILEPLVDQSGDATAKKVIAALKKAWMPYIGRDYHLGTKHFLDTGDTETARQVLAGIDPSIELNDGTRHALLTYCYDLGDTVTARKLLETASARQQIAPQERFRLAEILQAEGEADAALDQIRQAAETSDYAPWFARRAVQAMCVAGRFDLALDTLNGMIAAGTAEQADLNRLPSLTKNAARLSKNGSAA